MLNVVRRRPSAFTLIEMLVVIIIIGILMAIGIPAYLAYQSKAKDAAARADVTTAFKALAATKTMNNGSFPVASSMLQQARQDEPGMSFISGVAASSQQGKVNVSLTASTLTLATVSKSGKIITLTATSADNFSQAVYAAQTPSAGYAAAVTQDSPLLYWRFNDSTGATAAAVAGPTGTVGAGTTFGVPHTLAGGGNTAFGFANGNASSTVTLSSASAPNPANATVEFWLNATVPTTGNYNQDIIAKFAGGTGVRVLGDKGNDINLNGAYQCITGGVLDGTWHLIDITIASDGGYKCYMDGALKFDGTTNQMPSGWQGGAASNLEVGNFSGQSGGGLTGSVDEVAIYGSLLSAAQISAHWNAR